MIPKPKEVQQHAFGIVDDDARLRFLVNAAADAAVLSAHLAGLTALAVQDKLKHDARERQG